MFLKTDVEDILKMCMCLFDEKKKHIFYKIAIFKLYYSKYQVVRVKASTDFADALKTWIDFLILLKMCSGWGTMRGRKRP